LAEFVYQFNGFELGGVWYEGDSIGGQGVTERDGSYSLAFALLVLHGGPSAFGQLIAFKLGEYGQHLKNHPASGGSCVELLGETYQVCAGFVELVG
jgi:hypothetical protein